KSDDGATEPERDAARQSERALLPTWTRRPGLHFEHVEDGVDTPRAQPNEDERGGGPHRSTVPGSHVLELSGNEVARLARKGREQRGHGVAVDRDFGDDQARHRRQWHEGEEQPERHLSGHARRARSLELTDELFEPGERVFQTTRTRRARSARAHALQDTLAAEGRKSDTVFDFPWLPTRAPPTPTKSRVGC